MHLYGCECRHDGRTAEAMWDEGEVGEMSLDAGFQDVLRPRVAQGRPVLVQEIHKFFCHLSENK